MSQFTKILIVSPLADGRSWVLREEFSYDVGEIGSGDTINVPVNFITDFASVPRPFWWLFPRWGRYGNAAVIHDFLYWEQGRSRKQSDNIFLEAMGVLKVNKCTRYILFCSVRIFGSLSWRSRRHLKEAGWIKIATKMPEKSVETLRDIMKQTK